MIEHYQYLQANIETVLSSIIEGNWKAIQITKQNFQHMTAFECTRRPRCAYLESTTRQMVTNIQLWLCKTFLFTARAR